MKRLSLLLLLGLLPVVVLMADPVDKDAARLKAEAFFMKKNPSSARRAQVQQDISLALTNESFHVFNLGEDGGFVMIAGDDCAPDILGYSDSGSFDAENMPENLREWLDGYAEQIAWMKENEASPDPSQGGENGGSSRSAANSFGPRPAIAPLLTSRWGQGDPYNRQTPTKNGQHCVTGCVATSMAQVMHYWYKKIGYETRLWNPILFGATILYPTTFDWAHMWDDYDIVSSTVTEMDAVAKLMKYCGYSVGMDYDVDESGADQQDARQALTYNFGFRCARFITRSDFTNLEWMENIYTDLANGRPVIMAGKEATNHREGHSFVCDGYDKEDFFHFNWGWKGTDDGYYKLFLLNPTYNNFTFTYNQRAICCIHPTEVISLPVNPSHPITTIHLVASDVNIPELYSGEEQEVSMTVKNKGDVFGGMINLSVLVFENKSCSLLEDFELFTSYIYLEPGESKRITIPVKLLHRVDDKWATIAITCQDGLNGQPLYKHPREVKIHHYLPNLNGSVQIRETVAEPGEALTLKLTGDANNTDVSMRHRQWQISPYKDGDWTDIPGATGTQYYPTMDQVGKHVRVVVKVDGYHGKLVSDSRKVIKPTLKGTVTITRNNAPHPGATLYYHLEGKAADIDPSLIEVRWDYQTDPSKVLWHILSEGNNSYTLETSDLGKYFRVIIKAKGYESGLISDYILCRKDECRKEVVAPELSISTAYNQIQVTNPQQGQEYIIMNNKKAIDKLTEDDWEDSQTFGPSDNFLFMGGSPGRTFYVYTRVKETETTLAGTDVRMASIYFGENVYLQDIKIEAKKYNGAGSYVPLGESEQGAYYIKQTDILRLEAKPIPSNATNYNGIYYDNWFTNSLNGAFYSDYQCTKRLESGNHYKVVYYKPERTQNHVDIWAEFTKGYNDMAVDYFYVNVSDREGFWLSSSIHAEVNVSKGKISQNEEFTTSPSKGTIYGYRMELRDKTGEVPPDVAFNVLKKTVYVDATNASVGDYYYDINQYDVKLYGGVTIHVTTPAPEEIRILPEEFTLDCGEPLQLEAQLFPEGAEGEVTWSSSNTSVAMVTSDGLVTFKDGADIGATAIITATVGELSASCELTVAGEEYPIYIAGKQVTSRNMDDLAAVVDEVNGASGKRKTSATDVPMMYFDGEVLWLKNITINTGNSGIPGIVIDQPGVTVIIEGECGISSYSGIGLKLAKDTKIYGDGKLSITSNDAAIMLESEEGDKHINLEVNDIELSLFATNYAIKGSGNDRCSMTLNNVTGWWQGNTGIVTGLQGGLEMNSCHFVEPEGLEMISGSVFDGEALATYAALDHVTTLYEEFDNTPLIEEMYDEVDFVALGHYRLSHDCKWQTLCLPFNVYSFAGTPFEDATVMTLDTEGKNGFDEETGTLYLTFKSVTTTEAGKPYIVGFTSGDDCYQPILRAYFRSKTPQSVSAASEGLAEVKMVGTFTPVSFEDDYSGIFFIDGANDLYAATEWSYLNSFRAYFDVPSLHGGTATVKQIVVDFADAPDGIEDLKDFKDSKDFRDSKDLRDYYDLSGRKMVNGQSSNGKLKKGIYITGGKKVVIK